MHQILLNLANIDLITFCKANNIDCSGTHVVKKGRGFTYSLVDQITRNSRLDVTFHKSQVPTYLIYPIN